MITYGNVKRVSRHLHTLQASSCLDRFAERQARSMASKRQLFHQEMLPILKNCHLNQVGRTRLRLSQRQCGDCGLDGLSRPPGPTCSTPATGWSASGVPGLARLVVVSEVLGRSA